MPGVSRCASQGLLRLVFVSASLLLLSARADAGSPTRIQLVGDIPIATLSLTDESGAIAGPVDGIATDGLPDPGGTIVGAQLRVSFTGPAGSVTWGHLDSGGAFVVGLPAGGGDGAFADPSSGAPREQLYIPPVEFDLTGPSVASERVLRLAARIEPAGGAPAFVVSRELVLVKPPLVLVHGINSNPSSWSDFEAELRGNRGFRTFAVDHSGGSFDSGDPTYGGNGDVHDSYAFVRGGMPGSVGVAEALERFRTGDATAHAGKKIAVQKADLVGSSYGGILSRWYAEQALDYGGDVRKIITLGTPHRGAPATNMTIEALANPLIAAADAQLLSPFVSMATTLQLADDLGLVRWKDGGVPEDVVPALKVLSSGSEALSQLNDVAPFRDDVAYGSVVGTDDSIDFGVLPVLNLFRDLEPTQGVLGFQDSYFPWLPILDGSAAASDAIVPTWSQLLPGRASAVSSNHVSYGENALVHDIVALWLQDSTLPRGAAHRTAFQAMVIPEDASRRNAYVGSTLLGTESVGGGLESDAIVTVALDGPTLVTQGGAPEVGSSGGIVTATLTGMARVDVAGTPQLETLTLIQDGLEDTSLHVVSASIDPGSTPVGELFAFSIEATFGRTQDASVIGPDGSAPNALGAGFWDVAYQTPAMFDYAQSPFVGIEFPVFDLPTPFVPGESEPFEVGLPPGSAFTLEGGVHATSSGGGLQSVTSSLFDDDLIGDDLLVSRTFDVPLPPETFTGVLMPYSEPGAFLFEDGAGDVAGADGSSSEPSPNVYQELVQPSESDPTSDNVTVTVAP